MSRKTTKKDAAAFVTLLGLWWPSASAPYLAPPTATDVAGQFLTITWKIPGLIILFECFRSTYMMAVKSTGLNAPASEIRHNCRPYHWLLRGLLRHGKSSVPRPHQARHASLSPRAPTVRRPSYIFHSWSLNKRLCPLQSFEANLWQCLDAADPVLRCFSLKMKSKCNFSISTTY